jgi:ribosomal protein L11 methyltransferase
MSFYEIEFPLSDLDGSAVEAALIGAGASSITFVDGGDEPVLEPLPGEFRLWRDTRVRALFDASRDALQSLADLAAALGPGILATAQISAVADQAWERVWLADWHSTRFGDRLWVCPTTADVPAQPDAVVIRLDPGLAFGTGTHPTTALCLEAVDSLPWPGRSVIDYGCGSGILGIAALKLGAASAVSVDLDQQALIATRSNAAQNGVASRLTVQDPRARLAPADALLANILAGPLIELRPVLAGACKPGAELVLSGILENQLDLVLAAYRPCFHIGRIDRRADWCCIRARRMDT